MEGGPDHVCTRSGLSICCAGFGWSRRANSRITAHSGKLVEPPGRSPAASASTSRPASGCQRADVWGGSNLAELDALLARAAVRGGGAVPCNPRADHDSTQPGAAGPGGDRGRTGPPRNRGRDGGPVKSRRRAAGQRGPSFGAAFFCVSIRNASCSTNR
jgi:hypothetical protein